MLVSFIGKGFGFITVPIQWLAKCLLIILRYTRNSKTVIQEHQGIVFIIRIKWRMKLPTGQHALIKDCQLGYFVVFTDCLAHDFIDFSKHIFILRFCRVIEPQGFDKPLIAQFFCHQKLIISCLTLRFGACHSIGLWRIKLIQIVFITIDFLVLTGCVP